MYKHAGRNITPWSVVLAGANARNSEGAGVYEAGNLSGKTLIIKERATALLEPGGQGLTGLFQFGHPPPHLLALAPVHPNSRALHSC